VATAFVLARLYVRWKVVFKMGKDDAVIALALMAFISNVSTALWGTSYGYGRHVYDLIGDRMVASFNLQIMSMMLLVTYQLTLALIQISILLFYLRLSFSQTLHRATYIFIGVIVSFCLATCAANLYSCWPGIKIFNPACKRQSYWYATSALGLLFDIIIWVMPIRELWRLRFMSKRAKVGLIATFSVGFLAIMVSIARTATIPMSVHTKDPTYDRALRYMVSQLECALGIVCACLPSLR
ncbi:hypothetical protein BDZ91DRAFT_620675, partial [Kalaharituber pfeilii]